MSKWICVSAEKLYMTNNNASLNVPTNNIAAFKASSLKSNNFVFAVNDPYYSGGIYRTKVTIAVRNTNGVTPYYASNINSNINFVPLKFDISYVDKNNCVRDTAENTTKYSGYTRSDKQTETKWKHRIPTYKWSTKTSLSGYEYTGIYEDR